MNAMKERDSFNLGLIYERTGDQESRSACMKQIYEVEHGYKDVRRG